MFYNRERRRCWREMWDVFHEWWLPQGSVSLIWQSPWLAGSNLVCLNKRGKWHTKERALFHRNTLWIKFYCHLFRFKTITLVDSMLSWSPKLTEHEAELGRFNTFGLRTVISLSVFVLSDHSMWNDLFLTYRSHAVVSQLISSAFLNWVVKLFSVTVSLKTLLHGLL